MKAGIACVMVLVLAGMALGQEAAPAPTKAEVIVTMKTSLAADGSWARLKGVAGFTAADKADYVAALVPEAQALSGSARTKALVTVYSSFVGFGADTYGLGEKITASVTAVADPADKALAASYVLRYPVFIGMKTVAQSVIDTPGLSPEAQRIADGLGVLRGRTQPKSLVAAASLYKFTYAAIWKSWPLTDKVALKRLLAVAPVTSHAQYVTAVNKWMVKNRTADLATVSADYQTYLKDGAGGTDLLDGVTIPANDALGTAAADLLNGPAAGDLDTDARVNLLLLQGRNKEAFQAAEAALSGVSGDLSTGSLSANVHRLAKVIKAIDGNWKRATDYVNLFQPQAEGEPAPADPIPAIRQELGL